MKNNSKIDWQRELYRSRQPMTDLTAIQEELNKWGIYDWRDPSKYPSRKTALADNQWRWEFLRRDDGYRNDWLNWAEGSYEYIAPENLILYGIREFYNPALPYSEINEELVFQRYPVRITEGEEIPQEAPQLTEQIADDLDFILKNYEADGKIDLRFDPSRPIASQMEAATAMIEDAQKKLLGRLLRQRTSDNPSPYLQTLDAMALGVTPKDIGQKIFGAKDNPGARGWQAITVALNRVWLDF